MQFKCYKTYLNSITGHSAQPQSSPETFPSSKAGSGHDTIQIVASEMHVMIMAVIYLLCEYYIYYRCLLDSHNSNLAVVMITVINPWHACAARVESVCVY